MTSASASRTRRLKRTTLHHYRGYVRKHPAPFFGARPMDNIDRAFVENYLRGGR